MPVLFYRSGPGDVYNGSPDYESSGGIRMKTLLIISLLFLTACASQDSIQSVSDVWGCAGIPKDYAGREGLVCL